MVGTGGPRRRASLVGQERKVEKLVPDYIEELRLVHKTVDNVLVTLLLLKCSKHPVPDTEPTSIILIQAVPGREGELSPEEPVFPSAHLLAPWCTRWCEAVLSTWPRIPKSPRSSVWMRNW